MKSLSFMLDTTGGKYFYTSIQQSKILVVTFVLKKGLSQSVKKASKTEPTNSKENVFRSQSRYKGKFREGTYM